MIEDLIAMFEAANLINRGMCPDCNGVGQDANAHFFCGVCRGEGIRVIAQEEFETRADDGTLGWCQERDTLDVIDFEKAVKLFFEVRDEC